MTECQDLEKWEGTIHFELQYIGSKSEREVPLLHCESETYKIHIEGENPFGESVLKQYEDKKIIVHGLLIEGVLIADKSSIEIVGEPDELQ